jgi:hypothetical protein
MGNVDYMVFLFMGCKSDNTSEAQASSGRLPSMIKMSSFHYLRKMAALVAASLILPALAYADRDNNKDDHRRGDNERGGERHGDPRVSSVPEANTVWVLIPFMGAVLVVGSMHLWRRQKNASI